MRPLAVLLAVLLVAPMGALADHPEWESYVTLRDWEEGRFLVGAPAGIGAVDDGEPVPPSGVGAVNHAAFAFDVDPCRRVVLMDLLYSPQNATIAADGVGSLSLKFEFQAELWGPDGLVNAATVRNPGHGIGLGVATQEGPHSLRLFMKVGAAVDWQLRIRAREVWGDPACEPRLIVTEIEANPRGRDAGNEWVELLNPGPKPVDATGWTITTTAGQTQTWTFPNGTHVAVGERIVVRFSEGQFLDNEDESVELRNGFGMVIEATQPRSDAENDDRTWQLDSPGEWTFAPSTPGS